MKLDQRLSACAEFIEENSFIVDVGTDHGYLPVYLVQNGICRGAVASDIGKGPLNSARKNIKKNNLSYKISTCLSDGLKDVPRENITHIVIAGMGGETIEGILGDCDWASECVLILQPMSKIEELRKWLYEHGFDIEKEKAVVDGKYIYTIMRCVFTSVFKTPTPLEMAVGKLDPNDENARAFLERKASTLDRTYKAKMRTSTHYDEAKAEKKLCDEIRRVLDEH